MKTYRLIEINHKKGTIITKGHGYTLSEIDQKNKKFKQ